MNVQQQVEGTVFWLAKHLDRFLENKSSLNAFCATAQMWHLRGGIPRPTLAVGNTAGRSLPAVLLGIRLGTCELRFTTHFDGFPADISVTHDQIDNELRFVARQPEPFDQSGPWPSSEVYSRRHTVTGNYNRHAVRVMDISLSQFGQDADLDGYAVGHVGSLTLGDEQITSSQWSAYLLGLDMHGVHFQGRLHETQVTLRPLAPEPRWSGLAAQVRKVEQNQLLRLAEWATWRRSALPSGLPMLVRVDLSFPSPVSAEAAEQFLLEDLCWVLDLYGGRRLVPAGLWDREERCGLLKELGRLPLGSKVSIVGSTVMLRDYLTAVLPTWESISDDERRDIKIGIATLHALPPDLEAAVVIGAMGLEHLASALLPPAEDGYDLSKNQKDQIRSKLKVIAEEVAPDSEWLTDLPRLDGRLFQRPAPDRIGELCNAFGVAVEDGEISAYAKVRNPVTHGRIPTISVEEKIRAILFERHAIGAVLLHRLGFQGSVYDARAARIRN